MSFARPSAAGVAALVVLGLALGGCSGSTTSAAPAPSAAPSTSAAPSSSPTDAEALTAPSALSQPLTGSSFGQGDQANCRVTKVQTLLVLLNCDGRSGVIRGSAYERVKVGDHVVIRITEPNLNGRLEGTLIHVGSRS